MECCYNCYVIFTQCRFDVQSFKHWKYSFLDILMLIVVLNLSEFPDLSRHAMVSTHKITTIHREWHFQDCFKKRSIWKKYQESWSAPSFPHWYTSSGNALFYCNNFFFVSILLLGILAFYSNINECASINSRKTKTNLPFGFCKYTTACLHESILVKYLYHLIKGIPAPPPPPTPIWTKKNVHLYRDAQSNNHKLLNIFEYSTRSVFFHV